MCRSKSFFFFFPLDASDSHLVSIKRKYVVHCVTKDTITNVQGIEKYAIADHTEVERVSKVTIDQPRVYQLL